MSGIIGALLCLLATRTDGTEIVLLASNTAEGITLSVKNGILYTLKHQNLSQGRGSNLAMDYVNRSSAIIFLSHLTVTGALEVVQGNGLAES